MTNPLNSRGKAPLVDLAMSILTSPHDARQLSGGAIHGNIVSSYETPIRPPRFTRPIARLFLRFEPALFGCPLGTAFFLPQNVSERS